MIDIDFTKKLMSSCGAMDIEMTLGIEKGSLLAVYGESGAGKTTFLRILAGFEKPDRGRISLCDEVLYDEDRGVFVKPFMRNVGFVFQDYALFPNMNVRKNIEYAANGDRVYVDELLDMMGLKDLEKRMPNKLSGGQKQRVAIARALARKPEVLLLDEAMSALDRKMRNTLQDLILDLHKKLNLTTIMVSHDVCEIVRMADEVICLEDGKIIKRKSAKSAFLDAEISGKFKVSGEVVDIKDNGGCVFIVTVLSGNNMVKTTASPLDIENLHVGDKVVLSSKAFNPVLFKVH